MVAASAPLIDMVVEPEKKLLKDVEDEVEVWERCETKFEKREERDVVFLVEKIEGEVVVCLRDGAREFF